MNTEKETAFKLSKPNLDSFEYKDNKYIAYGERYTKEGLEYIAPDTQNNLPIKVYQKFKCENGIHVVEVELKLNSTLKDVVKQFAQLDHIDADIQYDMRVIEQKIARASRQINVSEQTLQSLFDEYTELKMVHENFKAVLNYFKKKELNLNDNVNFTGEIIFTGQ